MSHSLTPTIETERLRLRGHRLEDFPSTAALWGDPDVVRHITGRPQTEEECWSRLLRYAGQWALLKFGYWLVEEKSGAFVGEIGMTIGKRAIDPPLGDAPEIGWVLSTSAQGKGYATEAVRAALAWRDKALPPGRTVCIISPDNAPSLRIAEKNGFREERRATYHGNPTIVFAR